MNPSDDELQRVERYYKLRTIARGALGGTPGAAEFLAKLGVQVVTPDGTRRSVDTIASDALEAWAKVAARKGQA